MARSARARATRVSILPEEILVWEICLPPKSLLRSRAVCRAWCYVTSTRDFLLAHHRRQPSLPILRGVVDARPNFKTILAFDHRGQKLHPIARLDGSFNLEASCDDLLLLSEYGMYHTSFTVCNPVTRQHVTLEQFSGFSVWGMYLHRPTGDHRILLHRSNGQVGCYVFTLGSDQPTARYIGGLGTSSKLSVDTPALLRDSLHWLLVQRRGESREVLVFDTTAESFRQMHAPLVPAESYIFEMYGMLGIYSCNNTRDVVNIWVLHDYEGEVWEHGYRVKFLIAEITGRLRHRSSDEVWNIGVVSVDGDILLLVTHGGSMLYVNIDGELVDKFRRDGQHLYDCGLQLKQSLVQQTFFPALEGYAVNAVNSLPFV